jgi:histidyl-tRNA synthetase
VALIAGSQELAEQTVQVKNMADQTAATVPLTDVVAAVLEVLSRQPK